MKRLFLMFFSLLFSIALLACVKNAAKQIEGNQTSMKANKVDTVGKVVKVDKAVKKVKAVK